MQRLEHAKAIAYNGGSPVMMQDIAYTFDGVCNITDAANTAPPSARPVVPDVPRFVVSDLQSRTAYYKDLQPVIMIPKTKMRLGSGMLKDYP